MEEMIKLIDNKNRKITLYKVFDLFIRSVLTIMGTVSLVSILMFLNNRFGVSYFSCLIMTCFLPSIYSMVVNCSLERLDSKIKNMECELLAIENEFNQVVEKLDINDKSNDCIISNIEFRFEGLSNEKKLELLNCLKNIIPDSSYFQYLSDLDNLDLIKLDDMIKENYSRKR